MRCRSAVHDPGCRPALDRHLVEGGNQACRVPAARRPVRRGTAGSGELRRREGGVCLWRRRRWRTPLLLLLGRPRSSPRVVANPGAGRLTPAKTAALLLVAATAAIATLLLVAPTAATATAAVTTTAALALATLALATAPTIGGRRRVRLTGWRRAGGGGGGGQCLS